jgi:RNA polymerase sigma-70 factor (ECF subfamily)
MSHLNPSLASTPNHVFVQELTAALARLRGAAYLLARSKADADDLLQGTALRALAAHSQYKIGTNMYGWLYRIMRNSFYDSVGGRARDVGLEDVSEECFSREASQEKNMEMREVLAAIGRLPFLHREALLLYAVEAMSYDEIAKIQGCAVGTIKSRIARARRRTLTFLNSGIGTCDEFDYSESTSNAPLAACAAP